MPMIIDHTTLGPKLSVAHYIAQELAKVSSYAYPLKNLLVVKLFKLPAAINNLRSALDDIYYQENSDVKAAQLKSPYYLSVQQSFEIGISELRTKQGKRKKGFTLTELKRARECLFEINEIFTITSEKTSKNAQENKAHEQLETCQNLNKETIGMVDQHIIEEAD